MNREDVIRMAREAKLGTALCHNSIDGTRIWIEGADWHNEVERFAALVAAAEREACAQVAEDYSDEEIAAEIRARGANELQRTL